MEELKVWFSAELKEETKTITETISINSKRGKKNATDIAELKEAIVRIPDLWQS